MPRTVRLSLYDNSQYRPGRSRLMQVLWFFVGLPLLRCPLIPSSGFRRFLLRQFGARIGAGVVCKPGMRVKFPWRLRVGDYSWIGEDCWIDNLADVTIGRDCCVSQATYLCTGNHDWRDERFALIARPIRVEDGAWVGARAIVMPGVTVGAGAIAGAGSVVTRDVPPMEVHAGNPASFVRRRVMTDQAPQLTREKPA